MEISAEISQKGSTKEDALSVSWTLAKNSLVMLLRMGQHQFANGRKNSSERSLASSDDVLLPSLHTSLWLITQFIKVMN